jgi:hypothetical protein
MDLDDPETVLKLRVEGRIEIATNAIPLIKTLLREL